MIRGLDRAVTPAEARAFFASLGPGSEMIVKALGRQLRHARGAVSR